MGENGPSAVIAKRRGRNRMKSELDRHWREESREVLAVRVHEACRITGIGRSKFYELIASGDIEAIKVGRITLIPIESLRGFLGRCERIRGQRP